MQPEHLIGLNPEQLQAVEHVDGPLLIFAGAGSGKTRVLTRRIANLILSHDVPPSQIFAVTFTNKAAREMKERVSTLFRSSLSRAWISTFHASCARILRSHAQCLNFTENFAIYDSNDTLSVLKRVFSELKIDQKEFDPKLARTKIDRAKNNYLFPDDFRDQIDSYDAFSKIFPQVYEHYQKLLLESNAMDFGDLLCNTVNLLEIEPTVLEQLHRQFRYFMVDEYQDTNFVQYKLMSLLSRAHRNICVVGDDDQSIYAFRGANIENIFQFKKDFPDAKVITLETNYRSTKNILSAASAVIAKNSRRQKKTLRTENPNGDKIVLFSGYDEEEEANYIVRQATSLQEAGNSLNNIAVFYRINAQSRAIEEAFCSVGLPYQIYGSQKFYERKEIKDILGYFRLLVNPNDNEAFLRVINTPARGIGATAVGALLAYAESQSLALLPALEHGFAQGAPFLKGANSKKFLVFTSLFHALLLQKTETEKLLASDPENDAQLSAKFNCLAEFLKNIAEKSGYIQALKKQDSIESESRMENIFELFNVAAEFVKRAIKEEQAVSLRDFLERASLSSDLDKESQQSQLANKIGTLSLMTLHLAKGLEFDYVFFAGLEEGLLPHSRSMESKEELEEERRLCYVGMTRAKKKLFLTKALSRQTFGRGNWNAGLPSRFLYDIPEELIDG